MDEIRKIIEDALREAGEAGKLAGYSPIEGEQATWGVDMHDGEMFFVAVTEG